MDLAANKKAFVDYAVSRDSFQSKETSSDSVGSRETSSDLAASRATSCLCFENKAMPLANMETFLDLCCWVNMDFVLQMVKLYFPQT